jgi:hypothetical protein
MSINTFKTDASVPQKPESCFGEESGYVFVDRTTSTKDSQAEEKGKKEIRHLLVDEEDTITPGLQRLALDPGVQLVVSGGKQHPEGENVWRVLARSKAPSLSVNPIASGDESTLSPSGTLISRHTSTQPSEPACITSVAAYLELYPGFSCATRKRAIDCIKDAKASPEERLKAAEYLLVHEATLQHVLHVETSNGWWKDMTNLKLSISRVLADAPQSLQRDLKTMKEQLAKRSFEEKYQRRGDLLGYMHAGLLLESQEPDVEGFAYQELKLTDKTLT